MFTYLTTRNWMRLADQVRSDNQSERVVNRQSTDTAQWQKQEPAAVGDGLTKQKSWK